MRVTVSRCLAFGLVLVPLLSMLAMVAVAQEPDAPAPLPFGSKEASKLKADLAALLNERKSPAEDNSGSERAKLQAELTALLKRINESTVNPGSLPRSHVPGAHTAPKTKVEIPEGTKSIDPLRQAMNYYRGNDLEAALGTFRAIDVTLLSREDQAFVRYMTASCLRRLNKPNDALTIYREVAKGVQDDEFVAGCAVWQISMMLSNQELEAQIEQLRARQKTK